MFANNDDIIGRILPILSASLLLLAGSGCLVSKEKYQMKELELAEVKKKYEKKEKEVEEIKKKYDGCLEKIDKKNGKIEKLEELRKEAEDKIKSLSYKIEQYEMEKKRLEEQLSVINRKISDLTKEKNELIVKNNECGARLESMSARCNNIEMENKELRLRQEKLQSRVLDVEGRLNAQKSKLAFLKKERDNLASIVETIKGLVMDFKPMPVYRQNQPFFPPAAPEKKETPAVPLEPSLKEIKPEKAVK